MRRLRDCPSPPCWAIAVVWDPVHGVRGLADILSAQGIDLTGWYLTHAYGVSGDGTIIIGEGVNPAGDHEAWLAVIPPVPAAVPSLGSAGLILLAVVIGCAALMPLQQGQLRY